MLFHNVQFYSNFYTHTNRHKLKIVTSFLPSYFSIYIINFLYLYLSFYSCRLDFSPSLRLFLFSSSFCFLLLLAKLCVYKLPHSYSGDVSSFGLSWTVNDFLGFMIDLAFFSEILHWVEIELTTLTMDIVPFRLNTY